jgi:hypothetical protein
LRRCPEQASTQLELIVPATCKPQGASQPLFRRPPPHTTPRAVFERQCLLSAVAGVNASNGECSDSRRGLLGNMLRIDIAAFYTFDVVSAKLTSERTYYDQASVVEQMQAKVGGGSVAHPDDPRQEEPTTRRADSESRSVVAFLLSILRFLT